MSLVDVREFAEAARVAREVAEAAQRDYVDRVRAALDAGASVPEVAAAAGVTRTAVYAALRKDRAREMARWEADMRPVSVPSREQLLADYRLARHAQLVAQEGRTMGYGGDDLAYDREWNPDLQPITWRQVLEGSRTA